MSGFKHSLQGLYRNHLRELREFARRRVGPEASDDVVQDAFLRLAACGRLEALDNPRAYLYRVTANAAFDHGRRLQRLGELPLIEGDSAEQEALEPGPEQQMEQLSRLRRCHAALLELPAPVREVFLLHRLDGMPQAQIASELGIPKRTVERYVARALAHCLSAVES